ncbi:MAG: helix-turn-helix domain-containing protein [Pseudomonadota bacterium]
MRPSDLIATSVRREREQAGLSLSGLAAKAGLSKSTLSQIEAGHGNPSIDTLWSLANALSVPFSFLFENGSAKNELIRAGEGIRVTDDALHFSTTLLSKCPAHRRRDLYRTMLQPHEFKESAPHPTGTIEHVVVCGGSAELGPLGETELLGLGDYFRFSADVDHIYRARDDETTLLVIIESSG